ncbi:hypothetical protein [Krasilnikovia sp. M28-CT-15]|uniref:hypothetical protein n=1 Tax=Krasilnikovia sp. M28-CT-15 TaxID=3373540 RepID=UPI00387625E0
MTVTGIALICVGLVLLVAFRAVLFGGRKRRQDRAARKVAANRRALPAAPVDGPWAAQLPAPSADGPWAAQLPPASPDGPWAAEQSEGHEAWDAPGARPVRGGGPRRPRSADQPASGPRGDAPAAGRADARRSRGHGTATGRTRGRTGGGSDHIDVQDSGYADSVGPGYADASAPGRPATTGRGAGRGERRTVWLDPDPDAGAVVRSVPVVAGAAEAESAADGAADDLGEEPGSRRFRRRRGGTGPVQRRRRREENEDSQYVLASLGLADEEAPEQDSPESDLVEGLSEAGHADGRRADGYGELGYDGSGTFGLPAGDFSSTALPGPDATADPDGPAGQDGPTGSGLDAAGLPGPRTGGLGSAVDGPGGAVADSGGIAATLFDRDDDMAAGGAQSGARVGGDRDGFGRSEFDRPAGTAPEPPYRAAAPAPRGWPADRSDQRYGDRVEGWVRPQYRELPEADTAGAYWTPAPDGPYVEPSANGYGWPVPVEKLPAAPPYEPVTGFDLSPVSDLTTVVPSWPPRGDVTDPPRFGPARDSGAGILWGSARDDRVWGDSDSPEPYGWPPAGTGRRAPAPDPADGRGRDPRGASSFGGSARHPGPPRGSVPMPGSGTVPGIGRSRDFGPPPGLGVAPMQGLGPARGFGRSPGIGRPSGYAPAQGIGTRPEAVPLPVDERDPRARPRPRPRPRPGGAEARSTVYVSRHAADPG